MSRTRVKQPQLRVFAALVGAAALTSATAAVVVGAGTTRDYPSKPIRFIVPAAAGDAPDIVSRVLVTELVKQMGQQIVVDNRVGAGGVVATEVIARAAPDGYTVGQGNIGTIAIAPSVLSKLPFDPDKDLAMVVQIASSTNLLVVTPSLPVKSVRDLIEFARTNPSKVLYGGSNGSSTQLSAELFKHMTNTQMVHIPYKSATLTITDMMAGQLHLNFSNTWVAVPHVKSGRLRGLATTGLRRSPVVPDLPTVAEAGVPGYVVTPWGGLIGPAGMPKSIVSRLNTEVNKALASPGLQEKFAAAGVAAVGGTAEQFSEYVKAEAKKWAGVVERAGIKVN